MNATLTSYGRGLLLMAVFMHDVYVAPTGLWVAYTRDVPVANADGSQLDEPDPAGGYARAPVGALTTDNWDWTGIAEVYNVNQILFPNAPTAFWGLMQGWALINSETIGEGDCVAVGAKPEPEQIDVGDDAPFIEIATLAIGLYD